MARWAQQDPARSSCEAAWKDTQGALLASSNEAPRPLSNNRRVQRGHTRQQPVSSPALAASIPGELETNMKPYKGTVETLGHMKLTGHVFWGHCAAPNCSRGRKLDMDKLIAIYGEDFDYVEGGDAIRAAFVCDRCGHKGGRLTMDGQSSYAKGPIYECDPSKWLITKPLI